MRILLAPLETAGVAAAMRDGLRGRGHEAELVVIRPHPFGYTHDRLLSGYGARARAGLVAPLRYDVLHFQFGTTLMEYIDAAWGRVVGRPLILMHYWGDDCRLREVTMTRYPARARVYDIAHDGDRLIRRRLRLAGRLCAAALVSDLELLDQVRPFFRAVYLIPTPVRIPASYPPLPGLAGEGPIVLHAPSEKAIKGTAEILAAVEAVAAGRSLRVRTVSGMAHVEVLRELARADIAVDQLNSETFGVFALEAMALGKPVLLQFRREVLAPFARDVPLVEVSAETLAACLTELVDDPARRRELGDAGANYVRRVHAGDRVAEALEHVYRHARARPTGVFEATPEGINRYAPVSS